MCRVRGSLLRVRAATALLAVAAACEHGREPVAPNASLVVAVLPSEMTLNVGQSIALTANVTDLSGRTVVPDSVAWSCSDTTFAVVSRVGVLKAVRAPTQVIVVATAFRGRVQGSGQASVAIPVFPPRGPQATK